MEFGKRLKELRSETGLSQEDLARIINERTGSSLKRNTISNYENDVSRPDFSILLAITGILGVTPNQMLLDSNSKVNEPPSEYHKSEFHAYLSELKAKVEQIESAASKKKVSAKDLKTQLDTTIAELKALIKKAESL